MTAHVRYPALDRRAGRRRCPRAVVTRPAARRAGRAQGVVVTDAMEMKGVAPPRARRRGHAARLVAGCDLLLYGAWTPEA